MTKTFLQVVVYALIPFFVSLNCGTSRALKPLSKNQQAVDVSLGGPIFDIGGNPLPMPLLAAGYARGVTDKINVFGSFQITESLFGILHFDAGGSYQLLDKGKNYFIPELSTALHTNFLFGVKGGGMKVYPEFEISAIWDYAEMSYFYTGISNFIELNSTRAFEIDQPHNWFKSPFIGTNIGFGAFDLIVEIKWVAMNISTDDALPVEFNSLGGRGVPAPRIALRWHFGDNK